VLAQVRRTIEARELILPGARVLCACSGGPDSAALLVALARLAPELGFSVEVASVDHGLRPDAVRDVAIAGAQAESLGLPFHPLKVQVSPGGSLQAKARAARYASLKACAAALGATRIAVGHTRDDQAETVLLRLLRGSGLRGLGAIDPRRRDGVVRPLIDCDRAEAHQLARASFREIALDPSNHDPRFERVRIRAHVLPALLAEDPRLTGHLADLADEAREVRSPLRAAAVGLVEHARVPGAEAESLRISVLAERPAQLRRAALREWLEQRGVAPVARAHLLELDHVLLTQRGHVWLPKAANVRVVEMEQGACLLLVLPRMDGPPRTA
jgi:tRNA(Ile)-lysidine synthase